jgi:hypothetical protein
MKTRLGSFGNKRIRKAVSLTVGSKKTKSTGSSDPGEETEQVSEKKAAKKKPAQQRRRKKKAAEEEGEDGYVARGEEDKEKDVPAVNPAATSSKPPAAPTVCHKIVRSLYLFALTLWGFLCLHFQGLAAAEEAAACVHDVAAGQSRRRSIGGAPPAVRASDPLCLFGLCRSSRRWTRRQTRSSSCPRPRPSGSPSASLTAG